MKKVCTFVLAIFAVLAGTVQSGAAELNSLSLPEVGHHQLRILAPTLLEVTLVTTKEPDPAQLTQWNFVGENFVLNLPATTQFEVAINGQVVPVAQVGFKRRPLYAPLKKRDLRIENALYLKLNTAVPAGATVTVKNPSGQLWADATVKYQADAMRFNPAIHVNQVGYIPGQSKKAFVGYYLGSMGEMAIPATTFSLVNKASGAVVFNGTLVRRADVGYTYTPAPYQQVYEADFSAVDTAGEYVIQVPGLGVSFPFYIGKESAAVFARAYALGIYHQRCGCKNELPHTRFEHGICHAAPAEVPDMTYTAVNSVLAEVSADAKDNPLHTAPQLKDVASSLYPFINKNPIDVSRGHHDAGDYSKYTVNSAGLIHHLVFAADAFPNAGKLDNLGLPESHDGKSDLLQEAKWEADFLAKMQDADGGFYFLVYPKTRRYEDNVLPDQGDTQVVFPKTTAVTAAAVAALAEIASSPTFKAQYPTEAAAYLAKAKAGWTFLMNAIAKHGKNGAYQKITHYGNEFMHDDELAWAAAALFAATGEAVYQQKLFEWYDPANPSTLRWGWWRLFEGYGNAARTYAFAARSGRLTAAQLNSTYLAECEAELLAGGDDIARFAKQTAYGTSFPDPSKAYRSAGWYFSLERAFELATAQQLKPSAVYQEALLSNVGYEAGANPVNMSYITGLGYKRWRDIVHQYAQNDHRVLPPSGIPLGNIQGGFAWLENYKQELGRLAYPPDGATTAPYPYYDRFGDSFNTTTEFVVVDQARGMAALAYLLAQTGDLTSASKNMTGTIVGLPASIPAGESITATLALSGVDLSKARIVWEALDQEPVIGQSFTFSAKNPGEQWVEAEAQLPDGRRVYAKAAFTATFPLNGGANSYQSAPVQISSDMVAVYHLDGNVSDATGKNSVLSLFGNATLNSDNLGWMTTRTGAALHFNDLGDKATVAIPASLLYTSGTTTEITVEAMVYVNAYKGFNRGRAQLVSLVKGWNASLEFMEDIYSGTHLKGGTQFDFMGAALAGAMPVQKWHHLSLTIGASGYSARVNGALVASVASTELANWNGGTAALELGNFDGWVDEVVVRSRGGSTQQQQPAPTAPANFRAQALSSSSMGLTWSDFASNETGFAIYRSVDNLNFSQCGQVGINVTSFNDTGLRANTTYFYALTAFNSAGESAEVTTTGTTFATLPLAPTGLKTTVSGSTVSLTWLASSGADSYAVKRGTSAAGPFAVVATGVKTLSFTDSSLPSGTYYYVVSALNSAGESANSVAVSAAVTSLTAVAEAKYLGYNTARKGSWKNRFGAEGYYIIGDGQKLPSYASITPAGKLDHVWNYSTSETRALQKVSDSTRIAACWYSGNSFEVEVNIADSVAQKVSLYFLDWDRAGRTQKIELIDAATGKVFHSMNLGNFSEGIYLQYNVRGKVKFRISHLGGPNAVLSGLFVD